MQLILKGSLGDHICYTGIPKAYYNNYNQHLKVVSRFPEIWKDNPYIDSNASEEPSYSQTFEKNFNDWRMYRPQRIFQEMTGLKTVSRDEVQPKIYYKPIFKIKHRIIISDQAGWPSRRGYKYFISLAHRLKNLGFNVILFHNDSYLDCNQQIVNENEKLKEVVNHWLTPTVEEAIAMMANTSFYIGYDSAFAHMAAALNIPHIILGGGAVPIAYKHNTCILHIDNCTEGHCYIENCPKNCLKNAPDYSNLIIDKINAYCWS